ncbi:MAG: chemotaxis response regulator protein-glutamate methylesterase [Chloroflexi bacterium]|nr:chemotaxis response regulator protein-glutamate methylesterase [Chloroflexota bacterium]
MTAPARVVVVDDSPFICRLMTSHLQAVPDIKVVGTALNGLQALALIKELRPDVVTLDLEMPAMNGEQTLEAIMYDCPTPVVLVSGVSHQAAQVTMRALEMGAVDFILKYTPGVDTDPDALRQEIIAKVRAAARIHVIRSVRRRSVADLEFALPSPAPSEISSEAPAHFDAAPFAPGVVIVIGASTGGPVAVRELIGTLPADFPAALIVVQHIPATFTGVLAAQLNRHSNLRVKEAQNGDRLQAGNVLIAPGGYHLLVRADARVELNQGPEIGGHRPSIDVTMQSVAQWYNARAKGVVLTGMGSDGALGLVAIRSKGGQTFAQDAESCVVNGMPQRAIEKGVVDHVASPSQIAHLLRIECAPKRER